MMAEKVTIGNCELWHGDCLEILPTLEACAIVSDPPYGIGYVHSKGGRGGCHALGRDAPNNAAPLHGDDKPFDPAHLLRFDPVILFGADHYAQRLPRGRWLAWDKLGGKEPWDSFSDVEFAWHNKTGAARIFSLVWKGLCQGAGKDKGTKRTHPTQKPVALMEWCIEQAGRPHTICDPYMGTGATGVAAVNLGLHFIGVEIHGPYFEEACRRIEQAYAQPRLFDDAKVGAGDTALQGDMLLTANVEVTG
jgi:site-specific DNA-methyltransferase (adenine-specific)/modification methylase